MKGLSVFTAALGVNHPWYIEEVELREDFGAREEVGYNRRTLIRYEDSGYSVYDHQDRMWQHLGFLQYIAFTHVRAPRIKLPVGAVKIVDVPWAEKGSSFTVLLENKVIELALDGMSTSKVGTTVRVSPRRVFPIVNRRVPQALTQLPLEPVKHLSVDETNSRKGHNYLTILCERERNKVVGISTGKDDAALGNALIDSEIKQAERTHAKTSTMDMSKGYIASVAEYLLGEFIIFDSYHILNLHE